VEGAAVARPGVVVARERETSRRPVTTKA